MSTAEELLRDLSLGRKVVLSQQEATCTGGEKDQSRSSGDFIADVEIVGQEMRVGPEKAFER
jgi:hypothetical protein